jgi:hypothetical protein
MESRHADVGTPGHNTVLLPSFHPVAARASLPASGIKNKRGGFDDGIGLG